MKYVCTLLAVKNLEASKEFYRALLNQEVVQDLGANITMSGGFALQSMKSWQSFIHKSADEIVYGSNNAELYFEVTDMDDFMKKLSSFEVTYVHPPKEHAWGQRVVRFYDPDHHIIEVGENLMVVARRFTDSGMSVEDAAVRMDMPVEAVQHLLAQSGENEENMMKKHRMSDYWNMGTAIGLCSAVGIVLGAILQNLVLWLLIGAGVGVVLGAVSVLLRKNRL